VRERKQQIRPFHSTLMIILNIKRKYTHTYVRKEKGKQII